jgi:hypothetical protein
MTLTRSTESKALDQWSSDFFQKFGRLFQISWVMARTPIISEQDYLNLVTMVGSLGYNLNDLQKATHE